MVSPKVSVLLTSYNHAKYLRESIDSVLDQTFSDFELIIWDDASVDQSWDIIQSYSDPRIKPFKNIENKMPAFGIIKAIQEIAQGEYIAIHHSDDIWESEKLEKQVAFLDAHPEIGAVFSNALIIGENGEPLEDKSHPYYSIFDQPNRNRYEWLNFFFYHGNALCHPSVLIRKECYAECGLYRYGLAQLPDFDMWVRLCFKYDIHVLPEKLIRFRVRAGELNVSGNRADGRIRQQFEFFQIYNNYRNIKSAEEIIKIFPKAEKYLMRKDGDLGFALGMVSLEAEKFNPTNLFGLELLFEALNEPDRAKKIAELYSFTPSDFIALTAKKDVFLIDLKAQAAEMERALQAHTNSRTYKVALFLRQIKVKLFPLGSRREKLLRWGANSFMILIRRIWGRLYKWNIFSSYRGWIRKNEPRPEQLAKQRAKINVFAYKPFISVIVPVWNTSPKILHQTIGSVVDQTYDNWELCIADGNSNPETQKILSDWAKKDSRINIKLLNENKGIAVNSNEALSLAHGEFVAFLDHDDLLAPFALFEVVSLLQGGTNVDLVYSDEDKKSESGRRFDPFFKPDFSPDYLRSVNYMPHFLVVRKSLGDEIGWFREGYDGAQDYDLILRAVEKARSIAHIPKILYHWRASSESTASSADAKPYANNSGKKALQEHLDRIHLSAQVQDGFAPTFYRVRYHISNAPLISIIIPNQDHAADLEHCIDSILQKTTYPNFEIFLVENGSKEQRTFNLYKRLLEKDGRVRLIEWKVSEPFNYSRINNWAARQASGEALLFLNNDTQVINHNWLEQMLQFAMRPDVGAVGAKLYYPDERIQHAGIILGIGGVAGHTHKNFSRQSPGYFGQLVLPHNVSAVTAACLMVRKQVFLEINGFDETYAMAFGDVDLCLSILQKGYLNVWTPYTELYHHESKTRGYEDTPEKQERFRREVDYFKHKWARQLEEGDPYYNPNLTLMAENFSINPKLVNMSAGIKVRALLR